MPDQDAWGNYWRGGALTTFGDKPTYEGELRAFWLEFLEGLPDDAVLVDLGAGNGALEEIVQRHCHDQARRLTVHAVDAAAVSPQIKSASDDYCQLVWHPRTRNEATGLPDDSVDAIIGSYAFEYGDDAATVAEIARILKPGGRCRFLMHHSESVLIVDTAGELAVLEAALGKGGLLDAGQAFLREFGNIHKPSQFEKLKTSAKAAPFLRQLNEARARAAKLATTPNAIALLDGLIRGLSSLIYPPRLYEPKHSLLEMLADARREYGANRSRLRDMQRAAVNDERINRIAALFESRGRQATGRPFLVSDFSEPVGWSVDVE